MNERIELKIRGKFCLVTLVPRIVRSYYLLVIMFMGLVLVYCRRYVGRWFTHLDAPND